MQYKDDELIFAPTDLSRWLNSPYASWMARYAVEAPELALAKDEPDAMLSRLFTCGLKHEDALEQEFKDSGLVVVNVAKALEGQENGSRKKRHQLAVAHTRQLMLDGVDVIAQATLELGEFRGYADFLVKVPGASKLGNFHYEVWDTKLARRVKPEMVLQLCCYVDMLESIQGCRAADLVVALGNGVKERIALVDCFDYYLAVKQAFQVDQIEWSIDDEPDAALYSNHGNWSEYAAQKLEARDHLSRVARISRRQIERLEVVGIKTMTALAGSAGQQVPGIDATKLDWLVRQAALQCASASLDSPEFHVLEQEPGASTGLAALPQASPLDVFFDIEGFPLEGDGLEYLWGCTYLDTNGVPEFRDWWAHDTAAERIAFEGFIDWVHQRWREDPSMHIYHYAPYEITACKRLMGAHGTREIELDDLLRNDVFIDLYAIVTHGLQIGEPRYSIKNVERLYRPKRETDVASGGDSVVVYDLWREALANGEESDNWQDSEVLKGIRDYNQDDCDSTLELCQWLRARQTVVAEPKAVEPIPEPKSKEVIKARLALRDRILKMAENIPIDDDEKIRLATLAGVLEFHRREDKPAWWRFFDRMEPANIGLSDDPACLANCQRTSREPFKHTPRVHNLSYEFQFDVSQESKGITKTVTLKGAEKEDDPYPVANVIFDESDLDNGRIVLQRKDEPPNIVSLVPNEVIGADPIPSAIDSVVEAIVSGQVKSSALLDFIKRMPPKIKGHDGGAIISSKDTQLDDTIQAVKNLDNSCLIIQGPPGAGKTFTGARIIASLVADGKRVGITSNSHPAINNLLIGAAEVCEKEGISVSMVCAKNTSEKIDEFGITVCANKGIAGHLVDGCVIGTTAWGFARDDMEDALDVVVIDEAGQVALANLVAISRSAQNLVVMGDQRQLGQPTQGTHPAESGLSILAYRLGDTPAVDSRHGVFLGTTYRMHSKVNALISRHVYADNLVNAPVTDTRTLDINSDNSPLDVDAGNVSLPVIHNGNTQSSNEEVAAIVNAVKSLLGRKLTTEDGTKRSVTLSNILFVVPYNAQVTKLQKALGDQARIGNVDRFQGQEAPIVFLSLCSSDATASPRGLSFLFDRNRLNVAVSRAETLCVIVGHPRLAITPVSTVDDLKRVNFVAALMNPTLGK